MPDLLVLSNGHGEDAIAVRLLTQLRELGREGVALPLVGEGHAYQKAGFALVGKTKTMPSGGFVYMDSQQFYHDVRGGLLQLTREQYGVVKDWARQGGKILAVGDVLPLALAWLSGGVYGFVSTAKSEYYLRDEQGWLEQTPRWYRLNGSYYFPWELGLMRSSRCRAVFARDTLTGQVLAKYGVRAFDLGNPMMDGLASTCSSNQAQDTLTVVLLPGSRMPEALRNWVLILQAVERLLWVVRDYHFLFLAAITPSLDIEPFREALGVYPWTEKSLALPFEDGTALTYLHDHKARLIISQNAYADCLALADLGIALAGTATEQLVGLGKPVITFAGAGPQFTPWFAQAQTRLLGESVLLVASPGAVPEAVRRLIAFPDLWQAIATNGKKRLGPSGAAQRIARCLEEKLFSV
jgi:uncharacterized protein (TIGR03492 family)